MNKNNVAQMDDLRNQSRRAGLQFPVGLIARLLREGEFARGITINSAVFLAAVMEYLTSEIIELARNAALDNGLITSRHMVLAIRNNVELDMLLNTVIFARDGAWPFIPRALRPRRTAEMAPPEPEEMDCDPSGLEPDE